ncbi:polyprenyl synthetase family protein [Plebeiibacterium sediminum]|uniref:Polyprenyl synthetase family protein n=1 Tax=Plebeiibacterium sediminum TaxID=2992112 RepID=A0AAE3M1S0_9BACT|nr:polyprenyl synthetase family protein [Plebeiobacterium sediminum]MCW3785262.1 polyprenyl synthetase family protein [Plebeiobacterium sediminum]
MEKTQFKYKVPSGLEVRKQLRSALNLFVKNKKLSPPLSMNSLTSLAIEFITVNSLESAIKGWIMVEINNAVWFETVASIPLEKRILLLPKCLSNSKNCKAEIDDLGLLCNLCGNCNIPDLQTKAEELGMMSLVAEGFTSVIGLVESGVIDAIIGVSCLESLEKTFPLLINHAVPGLAIPLNKDGCIDTEVDEAYVREIMEMHSSKETTLLDYDQLKSNIQDWFSKENLENTLTTSNDHTSLIMREWMSDEGKRWRPYLLAATYMALNGKNEIPEEVKQAAIAIECFHKASLVHDDIQDEDSLRYGKKTINEAYGVPIAINVGDMYLGEGYRLLAQCKHIELFKVASEAHIALCKGQGMELEWSKNPKFLNMNFVLDIFCHKTVPAFEVSLLMGAICVDNNEETKQLLSEYAKALGIAYQLKDDIEDFNDNETLSIRPSAVLATICENTTDDLFVHTMLHQDEIKVFLKSEENIDTLNEAIDAVEIMVKDYHNQALNIIESIQNIELKRLLFRVTEKILK